MKGDATIGMTTLSSRPAHLTVTEPASAAPTRPPIRACDDEDGRPCHQVNRFQTIAPINPARTTVRPPRPCGAAMIPDPTVRATLVEISAPRTFMAAAITSATRGVRARVETVVAMAFAESWNPLV